MELIPVLGQLKTALESAERLAGFVNNEMAKLVEQIGDAQYAAALDALKQARFSGDSRREIESAVTCLRLAYETFLLNGTGSWLWKFKEDFRASFTGSLPADIPALKKAAAAAILIATCYKYLGEHNLVDSYVHKALECFERYAASYEEYSSPPSISRSGLNEALRTMGPHYYIKGEREELTRVGDLLRQG